ncbi:hypothetical protein Z052_13930 [Halorubrum sp. C191]|uniref:DUF1450 domain-containing protein n=1 Tax=Halorubrum sp. C191 TaxID=1383842 RepID=UPI000C06CDD3|nr:DUF1450 domain-containing protein [Halorubrum sp. C191]PHQ41599.1 hypothetical protein Z052_13930 [Halorubrum sp. C191]
MSPTIERCISSSDAALRSLPDRDGVNLRERRCLEHCGICRAERFAVVNGELLTEPELSTALDALAEGTAGERP